MKKTTVINCFGGPGIGKSTLAAALFAKMKEKNLNCEMVREYVKTWAWQEREIKATDQIYVLAKQCQAESILYGKVDYVITDCPILLPGVYQRLYHSGTYIGDAGFGFINDAINNGVNFKNYILNRGNHFETEGRFHSKEEAIKIDKAIPELLTRYKIQYRMLLLANIDKLVEKILKDIEK